MKEDNKLLYYTFGALKLFFNVIVICLLLLMLICIYDEVKYRYDGYTEYAYIENYVEKNINYKVEIKDLNDEESLVEVYIENAGREKVELYDNKLSIYKYGDEINNISQTKKVAEIYLVDEKGYYESMYMDGISFAKVKFKVPKEVANDNYKIDFDTIVDINTDWLEDYYESSYQEFSMN